MFAGRAAAAGQRGGRQALLAAPAGAAPLGDIEPAAPAGLQWFLIIAAAPGRTLSLGPTRAWCQTALTTGYPTQLSLPDDRVLVNGGYASEADPPTIALEVRQRHTPLHRDEALAPACWPWDDLRNGRCTGVLSRLHFVGLAFMLVCPYFSVEVPAPTRCPC